MSSPFKSHSTYCSRLILFYSILPFYSSSHQYPFTFIRSELFFVLFSTTSFLRSSFSLFRSLAFFLSLSISLYPSLSFLSLSISLFHFSLSFSLSFSLYLSLLFPLSFSSSLSSSLPLSLFLISAFIDVFPMTKVMTDQEREEEREETGWKLVHADVFRPPLEYPMLFCVSTVPTPSYH